MRYRISRNRRLAAVIVSALAAVALLLGGCGVIDPAEQSAGRPIRPGQGSFEFEGAESVTGRPVRVWYDAPQRDLDTARILIVVHGHERNARAYRADWTRLIKDRHVLLLAPEFPADYFSDEEYNLGNMVDGDGDRQPEDEWTFRVIESLFRFVKSSLDSQANDYVMFGHSAGAQFVHRFVEFGSPRHLRKAVAANAGWYTVPDDSEEFPYGLDGVTRDEDSMRRVFQSRLVVMLGADDNDPDDDSLRRDDQADEQGTNRLDRGLYFFRAARESADDHDLEFAWSLQVIPGVGHSHTEMARAAAPVLLGHRR